MRESKKKKRRLRSALLSLSHPVRGRVSVGSALAGGGVAHAEQGRAMMAPLPGAGETAAAVMVTLFVWRLKTSRLGRAMQAVRDNELAASTCGINVYGTKVVAFGISAVLGAIGGGLFAGGFRYISPDQFAFGDSIVMLTKALLGGATSP